MSWPTRRTHRSQRSRSHCLHTVFPGSSRCVQSPDASSVPGPTRRSTAEPAYAYGTEYQLRAYATWQLDVGPRLPTVDPVRRLVRRFQQRYQQRPLFGLGPSGVVAFPERAGIVLVQPRADGGAQLVQRHEQTRASPRPTPWPRAIPCSPRTACPSACARARGLPRWNNARPWSGTYR